MASPFIEAVATTHSPPVLRLIATPDGAALH
jgi:hypothetical protein